MSKVCAVSNYPLGPPDAAGPVDVLQSGELGTGDPLSSLNDAPESFPVLYGVATVTSGLQTATKCSHFATKM